MRWRGAQGEYVGVGVPTQRHEGKHEHIKCLGVLGRQAVLEADLGLQGYETRAGWQQRSAKDVGAI